uniref:Uncharacterized protein n=1 Tax=Arundo donax TaxID=35708 RepID=A0A0A9A634_ARUDO
MTRFINSHYATISILPSVMQLIACWIFFLFREVPLDFLLILALLLWLIGRWLMLIRYSGCHGFQVHQVGELLVQVLFDGQGAYAFSFLELYRWILFFLLPACRFPHCLLRNSFCLWAGSSTISSVQPLLSNRTR